jgi:hypothetical protein
MYNRLARQGAAIVTKEIVGIRVLLTRSLFASDIPRMLLLRVSLAKPTSAPLRTNYPRLRRYGRGGRRKFGGCQAAHLEQTSGAKRTATSSNPAVANLDRLTVASMACRGGVTDVLSLPFV